ncbi:nucleotidyl transferase AbiEii/AbiGii toxin family protein [Granulicella sp. WH15]|uniref:nucleotidyl transferase AbiEii/AbiGii toxin family protein n=1 Tax=Granulicella sp. WH15 TaxID=2602070 RepID=UPI001366D524|nr:nucleotidyl transferase AbiEii/AbiGii toxin family protein [Granulicella sp. WH15]QHN03985.1 nucleotidyl transferase AbiEii/AbiGii toxin family protein [Granulicella sp. WH15]
MTEGFQTILAASDEERRDLFVGAANRLRTNEQNIEKDFWVCWTLDALFNELEIGGPRLLFKGGTSLSKGYGLIERFSEDIDITVFREDIGQPATVEELEALSGKKRNARLDAIKAACQEYIQGPMLDQLSKLLRQTLQTAGLNANRARVEPDPADPDGQSLLLWYPTSTVEGNAYIRRAIKIESGAKSALDPHAPVVVEPYIVDDLPNLDLAVGNVTTVDPSRTFWDKIVILHGLRRWWDRRGELRGGGQRVSRHYYDVYRLLASEVGRKAKEDFKMAEDCVRHARMFFNRPDLDLATAVPGTFALTPHDGMLAYLRRDYEAMSGMIFGPIPNVDEVVTAIAELELWLNRL